LIEQIVGSVNRERILIFLECREQGYAREISKFYSTELTPIQKQLKKLEDGGVIFSKKMGKTILFSFNPRYPFLKELRQLLAKVVSFYPEEEKDRLLLNRRRPRKRDKSL